MEGARVLMGRHVCRVRDFTQIGPLHEPAYPAGFVAGQEGACRTADDESGAGDVRQVWPEVFRCIPEKFEAGGHPCVELGNERTSIVLPEPLPGDLPDRVPGQGRIEEGDGPDDVVEAGGGEGQRYEVFFQGGGGLGAVGRAGIDEDEPRNLLRMAGGVKEGVPPSHGMSHEGNALRTQIIDEKGEIRDVIVEAVSCIRSPLAFAVTPLIESDDAETPGMEKRREIIPDVGMRRQTVEE